MTTKGRKERRRGPVGKGFKQGMKECRGRKKRPRCFAYVYETIILKIPEHKTPNTLLLSKTDTRKGPLRVKTAERQSRSRPSEAVPILPNMFLISHPIKLPLVFAHPAPTSRPLGLAEASNGYSPPAARSLLREQGGRLSPSSALCQSRGMELTQFAVWSPAQGSPTPFW